MTYLSQNIRLASQPFKCKCDRILSIILGNQGILRWRCCLSINLLGSNKCSKTILLTACLGLLSFIYRIRKAYRRKHCTVYFVVYLCYNCKTKSYFIGCPITIHNVASCVVAIRFISIDNAVRLLYHAFILFWKCFLDTSFSL